MNDVLHIVHVQPARRHISGHQYSHGCLLECLDCTQTLSLLHLRVQGAAVNAQRAEKTVQATRCLDAIREEDAATRVLHIKV